MPIVCNDQASKASKEVTMATKPRVIPNRIIRQALEVLGDEGPEARDMVADRPSSKGLQAPRQ